MKAPFPRDVWSCFKIFLVMFNMENIWSNIASATMTLSQSIFFKAHKQPHARHTRTHRYGYQKRTARRETTLWKYQREKNWGQWVCRSYWHVYAYFPMRPELFVFFTAVECDFVILHQYIPANVETWQLFCDGLGENLEQWSNRDDKVWNKHKLKWIGVHITGQTNSNSLQGWDD